MTEGDTDGVLGRFIDDSHHTPPDRLGALVADHVRSLGATEAVVYLSSIEQRTLKPLTGYRVPARESLEIDATLGGRAFRTITTLESPTDGKRRLWVPLLDGTARLGVLELVTDRYDDRAVPQFRQFAGVVSELIVSRSLYGDLFTLVRRNRPMSLAAELQWSLLPPQTFNDQRITVSAMLEPAYDIAGDSFDYSFNGDIAHFIILDAMGHGFEATILAAVALAAYRHARRSGYDLAQTYATMDQAVAEQFGPDRFLTAQIGQLNAETGEMHWLNAGHPSPLHVRHGNLLGTLECTPTLPVGFGGAVSDIAKASLEPGDHVLFYTDGLVEARSPEGEFFGEDRLGDLLVRAINAELPAAEASRRLVHAILSHQDNHLQDDATTMLLNWHGPSGDRF